MGKDHKVWMLESMSKANPAVQKARFSTIDITTPLRMPRKRLVRHFSGVGRGRATGCWITELGLQVRVPGAKGEGVLPYCSPQWAQHMLFPHLSGQDPLSSLLMLLSAVSID